MIGWHHIYKSRLATPCSQSLKRVRVFKGRRCGGSQIEGSPEARTERARPPAEPSDDDGPRRKGGVLCHLQGNGKRISSSHLLECLSSSATTVKSVKSFL